MTIHIHNSALASRLDSPLTPESLAGIEILLEGKGTFEFHSLPNGLFPAAVADEYTGYGNVWVRDNVQLGHQFLALGETDRAVGVIQGLTAFFHTQRSKIDRIIDGSLDSSDPMNRPHIRFNGRTLSELDEKWSHAQNDALGYYLWLASRLVLDGLWHPGAADLQLLARFVPLFHALRFWEDKDSGHWEEQRKVAASSIGTALTGLRTLRDLLAVRSELHGLDGEVRGQLTHEAEQLIETGHRALDSILPWECRAESPAEQRRYDAALLFLIYPLRLLDVAGNAAGQIVRDVHEHLEGSIGVRRYLGDSYWCADYKEKLSEETRTADFSDDLSSRDALLRPGEEAQWCIFDPILSVIYGLRFSETRSDEDRHQQEHYLRRSLAQITSETGEERAFRCPESYYLERGRYVPNDVTPLLWTQANLRLALRQMMTTLTAPSVHS